MSPLRVAPVTTECLFICSALFAACLAQSWEGQHFRDVQREWGANTTLQIFAVKGDRREAVDAELNGPFDLWDGEWWRIPISAFHHADIGHLLINCLSMWTLGKRLERHWGSLRFGLFLLPTIPIPLLAEAVLGHAAIGFSGVICAMLGALIALKQFDDDNILPDQAVQFGLVFLVLCIWATAFDLAKVANVAHFVGLGYGWFATWVLFGPFRSATLIRLLFVLAHIGLLPATWYAQQPFGNGRYHWYAADHLVNPVSRTKTLKFAVFCDPSLSGVWLRLASGELAEGDLPAAWNSVLTGLKHNPTHTKLLESARSLWRQIPSGESRQIAEQQLISVFGTRGHDWLIQIRETALASALPAESDADARSLPADQPPAFRLDQKIDLDWQPRAVEPNRTLPNDPAAPGSAAEGVTL